MRSPDRRPPPEAPAGPPAPPTAGKPAAIPQPRRARRPGTPDDEIGNIRDLMARLEDFADSCTSLRIREPR